MTSALIALQAQTAAAASHGNKTDTLARSQGAAEAGKAFEELLFHELMKAMRATVPGDDDTQDGFSQDTWTSMFDQTLAEQAAGSLGVGRLVERQMGDSNTPSAPQPVRLTRASDPLRLPHIGPALASSSDPSAFASRFPGAGELPVAGRISSEFGMREHPITGEQRFHAGLDIAADEGTEIRAIARGVVTFAGRRGGYGNTVEIRHDDGAVSRYAHASRLHVHVGDQVDGGEAIADVGSTGQSTGPHLHFEVRVDGRAVNPQAYLQHTRPTHARAQDPRRTGIL